MGYGPLLILTPKIVEEQWVKSDPLNGTYTRRFQNNNTAPDQIRDLVWFVKRQGEVEIPAMHQHGVHRRLVSTSAEPSEALFKCDPLCHREGPVDGVQLGMPVYATVIAKVRPENRTRIHGDIPFSFSLQELKSSWPGLEHRESHEHCKVCPEHCYRPGLLWDPSNRRP